MGKTDLSTKVWTLGQGFEDCLTEEWKGRGGETSAVKNSRAALEFFGAKTPLSEITTDWIYAWVTRLRQIGNSNGTINRKLAALSKIMSHAFHRGKMPAKPNFPKRKQEPEGRQRFLTQEEETRALAFLSQWEKDEHVEVFCVLVDTGMRPSELWRLETRHCNFETGMLLIPKTKNNKARSVPMTSRVKGIIARRLELTPQGQRVFPFDNNWMEHVWQRLRYSMQLGDDKEFVPYALRHTCASRLVQRGVHLSVVKEWLGHKNIQVTMRYAHLSPANLSEAVKVLEA